MALNPPILENQVPAFYKEEAKNIVIKVPFQLPRSVGPSDIKNLQLVIKTINTGKQLQSVMSKEYTINSATQQGEAIFELIPSIDFVSGQYYKLQIAFIEAATNNLSEYSTTAAIKCTSKPQVTIKNLTSEINPHMYEYIGFYQNVDSTEKVVSYSFNLYNEANEQVATTGTLLHNIQNDTEVNNSIDTWYIGDILQNNIPYNIEYIIITNNGLKVKSPRYTVFKGNGVDSGMLVTLRVGYDIDNAVATIEVVNQSSNFIYGNYVLLRSSNESNWAAWDEICRFELTDLAKGKSKKICIDKTIAHGYEYKYAIQRYNQYGIYSKYIESNNIVIGEFEDMYLSDKNHQLKIRFNPKVNSFKNTILETKTDTIGGRFPVFYRNALTKYKEFPISGLISILMDPNELFVSGLWQEDISTRTKTPAAPDKPVAEARTQLVSANINNEREFKLRVMEWLTNGEPKLFRSATEGNYIVRLMNVSLSPNDTLGRMLHTFSATAYEIEEYTFNNLQKYSFISEPHVDIRDIISSEIALVNNDTIALPQPLINAYISTAPYATFTYTLNDGTNTIGTASFNGQYILPSNTLSISADNWALGSKVQITHYAKVANTDAFETITKVVYILESKTIYAAEAADRSVLPEDAVAIYLRVEPIAEDNVSTIELDDEIIPVTTAKAFISADLYNITKIIANIGIQGEIYYIKQIREE